MSIKDVSLQEILQASSGKDSLKNDRISALPDDTLIQILSSLTLKEAGSTSLLSKRWRHVWAYVPSLKFDCDDELLTKLCYRGTKEEREQEELKYFRWVEQVVNSHKAHIINEFMIRYDVHDSRKDNIDNWLMYAMEKRVKRLQLYIRPFMRTFRVIPYTLPTLSLPNTLISLQLCSVQVSGEVLEKFLCDCQALESLSVTESSSLVKLKVVGSSLNLKSLKLWHMDAMEHLEISAPNLISFHYFGRKIRWPLISTPKLAEFSFNGDYGLHIMNNFMELSSISSQIEVLTGDAFVPEVNFLSRKFPVFRRLKMLDFTFFPTSDVELFRLTTLLKCCPRLNKFVLEYHPVLELKMTKKTRNFKSFCHQHLKIIEIRAFMGCEVDVAFILYLTKGAVSAEKLIVSPGSWKLFNEEKQIIAEKEAVRLGDVIKPGLEFEIREEPSVYIY